MIHFVKFLLSKHFCIFYSWISHKLFLRPLFLRPLLFSERAWWGLSDEYKWIALIDLDFLLRSVEICKKCTILGNLRTITQEGKKELRRMTPSFFIYFLSSVCDIHFCIWNLSKFSLYWSAKYLNFGGESCEIRFFPCLIQETNIFNVTSSTKLFFCHKVALHV